MSNAASRPRKLSSIWIGCPFVTQVSKKRLPTGPSIKTLRPIITRLLDKQREADLLIELEVHLDRPRDRGSPCYTVRGLDPDPHPRGTSSGAPLLDTGGSMLLYGARVGSTAES